MAKISKIYVAQLGARRNYAIPKILHEEGLLECFHTDLCSNVGVFSLLSKVVPASVRNGALRRSLERIVPDVPRWQIRTATLFGLRRSIQRSKIDNPAELLADYLQANADFGHIVSRKGFKEADAVYAFNGAAMEIFEVAKARGVRCILDQTLAPMAVTERLIDEERGEWPDWDVGSSSEGDWRPIAQREEREWELADQILCGSEFVVDSMRSLEEPTRKCSIIPYGVDPDRFRPFLRTGRSGALRVLYVGTIELRKGVQYLYEAIRALGDKVNCRAVGTQSLSAAALGKMSDVMTLPGRASRYQIYHDYEWADVLVFPSLSEGSASVTYEALSMGLPVITTPNAGSIVRDGVDGYVVPVRSSAEIESKLSALANDRDLLKELSKNAVKRARAYTWDHYAKRLVSTLREMEVGDCHE